MASDTGTESELCADFMSWAREQGHRCYPEWAGWDILVVAPDGTQIGVEAKLRANVEVLEQAMSPAEHRPGPTYHAVLVPTAGESFKAIARRLKVWVMEWSPRPAWRAEYDRPSFPSGLRHSLVWNHPETHEEPPVEELSRPAGVPSPSSLTPWKLKAIRLLLVLERRGYVTSKDFEALGLSIGTTWLGRWIKWDGTKEGRRYRYVAIPESERHAHDRRPDELHPEVTAALREETP